MPTPKKVYNIKERYQDFHFVFGSPQGRRVLQLFHDMWMRPSAFDEDPTKMAFKLGKQEAFRQIMHVMSFDNFTKLEEFVYARSIAGQPESEPALR